MYSNGAMTLDVTTLDITTLDITTLDIMTLGETISTITLFKKALNIMALGLRKPCLMTLNIRAEHDICHFGISIATQNTDIQHNNIVLNGTQHNGTEQNVYVLPCCTSFCSTENGVMMSVVAPFELG
jgi:hypothetical protein